MLTQRKDELHENVVVSNSLANLEQEKLMQKGTKETLEMKYKRLANEYEEQGRFDLALKYQEERAKVNP